MPLIVWSDILSVGIKEIDAEHKELVRITNHLCDAISADHGQEALGKTLTDLVAYTQSHFAHEERLFAKTNYPDAEAHKKEHEMLTRQVIDIQRRFNEEATAALSLEVMGFLREWLITHIQGSDMKYAPHLKSQGIN